MPKTNNMQEKQSYTSISIKTIFNIALVLVILNDHLPMKVSSKEIALPLRNHAKLHHLIVPMQGIIMSNCLIIKLTYKCNAVIVLASKYFIYFLF